MYHSAGFRLAEAGQQGVPLLAGKAGTAHTGVEFDGEGGTNTGVFDGGKNRIQLPFCGDGDHEVGTEGFFHRCRGPPHPEEDGGVNDTGIAQLHGLFIGGAAQFDSSGG